ncbi:hypothetical protein FRC12_009190 [Ceratobasidium sp. 428]|nr:hypothetical protein FRC12_009190 [Ceratobasidium sp. 428]
MATRMWDDSTEGEVWLVEPELETQDYETDYATLSDTDSSVDTLATIESADVASECDLLMWLIDLIVGSAFFRIEHGRAFSAYEGVPMVLPTDSAEIRRLRVQHLAIKLIMGGTLDEIISTHLTLSSDGRRKSVLDVRTQTGMWAEEMALAYPEVDIKSIDVAPTIQHIPRHNLQHEVYDIHEGILESDATFDIVHARHTIGMIKDWRSLLRDMHRVLRPGGLFIFAEIYPQLTFPEEHIPALKGSASRSASLFEELRAILSKRGVLVEGTHKIDAWLSPQDVLWESRLAPSGFHRISHRVWELPINGLWHPDPLMQEVGLLMAMNTCQFVESTRPMFLSSGMTDPEFDAWVEDIRREVRDPMNNSIIRYHVVCAYKL